MEKHFPKFNHCNTRQPCRAITNDQLSISAYIATSETDMKEFFWASQRETFDLHLLLVSTTMRVQENDAQNQTSKREREREGEREREREREKREREE